MSWLRPERRRKLFHWDTVGELMFNFLIVLGVVTAVIFIVILWLTGQF